MSLKLPEPIGTIQIEGKPKTLLLGYYTSNQRIALFMTSADGEPFATISRNIPDLALEGDEFFVAWYDLNPQILQDLLASPYFEVATKYAESEHVKIPVWRLCPLIGVIEGGEE